MSRLWDTEGALDPEVLAFTVGEDYVLDLSLVPFDVAASIAHAEGLARIGVLTAAETRRLVPALRRIARDWHRGKFAIAPEDEDVHTAIENRLVARLGAPGKKIHAGRSRNDQVAVALRLLAKHRLIDSALAALDLARDLLAFAARHAAVPMPGYSHTRQAMPTTVGHTFASYAEGLLDDLDALEAAYQTNDRCPLGAAAGFGAALPLDREFVARRLGFAAVQVNTLGAISGRAKAQWLALVAATALTQTLARMAADVIAFSDEAHGFLLLAPSIATGSSIMPQKRNPDVFELIRASAVRVAGACETVRATASGLGSGYHRDAQLTKEPFVVGTHVALESLRVARVALAGLSVNVPRCREALVPGIFSADRATALAARGVPFREAYRRTKAAPPEMGDAMATVRARTSTGAPGNLALPLMETRRKALARSWTARRARFRAALGALLGER
jgi:argininosuccinate lyase